jgi:hypothetical protein
MMCCCEVTDIVNHHINALDGGRPAGRLQFDAEMEQLSEVSVTFKEVQVTGLDSAQMEGPPDVYLDYYYSDRLVLSFACSSSSSALPEYSSQTHSKAHGYLPGLMWNKSITRLPYEYVVNVPT